VPCLDLVNTVDRSAVAPWVDRLTSYGDLLCWSAEACLLTAEERRRLERTARRDQAGARAVLERARGLREATFGAFSGLIAGEPVTISDLEAINAEVANAMAHARVAPAPDGFAWTLEEGAGALDAPLWPLARSAAELLVSPDRARVKQCASETCLWLFLDKSKNGKRRWCEMKTCGNRAKVREHRKRKRACEASG
jgi:predicted RNA-binding Zn ribbon-like protein